MLLIAAAHESGFDVVDGARSRHRSAIGWFVGDESHQGSRPHANYHDTGIDAAEKVIVRKQLRRGQVTASRLWRHAWSAWRPVPRRTIGRAS